MVFLIDQSVIFASPGRVARIVADKRVAASPKFFWVPDDRVQMAGIEMRLGSAAAGGQKKFRAGLDEFPYLGQPLRFKAHGSQNSHEHRR